jgi:type I restriction enzyme S subunit
MPADNAANAEDCMGIKVSDMNLPGNERQLITAALMKQIPNDLARRKLVPPNTVVFPKRGAAIATNKKRLTTIWTVLDPNLIGVRGKNGVEAEFLLYWLQLFDLRTITSPGPTPQLNKKDLVPVLIPLPDKTEQIAIAKTIRDTTELLETLDKLIAKKKRVKQGAMQELLTGRKRLPGFPTKWRTREIKTSTDARAIPQDWNLVRLNEISSIIGDGIHTTPEYIDSSDIFFINGNNLIDGSIKITENTKCVDKSELKKYKKDLNENTILMSINGTIGNLGVYKNEQVILGKSVAYINLKRHVGVKYVFYLLQTPSVKHFYEDELTGTTIRNLSLKSIRNTPITLPQNQKEQSAIAQLLSDMDAEIEELEKRRDKYLMIKKGIMQQLLTGRIRLR